MKKTGAISALTLVALAVLAASALAAVPATLNYQVMLTNDSDEPLADTGVELVFHIYNQEVGGSPIWTETHNTTTNSIGVVSVILGTTNPIGLPFSTTYWLEVEVDSETMTPRRELTAAAYARMADDSEHLGGLPASYFALSEDLGAPGVINTPSNPVDWTNLKNVPAGFADGTDDAGGAGDGHSLDANDGNPVDALYVDATGQVGIGVTNPANNLVVHTGAYGLAYAQFVTNGTGQTANDGFEVGVNGSGNAFINQQESAPISFLTNGVFRMAIDELGIVNFGGGSNGYTKHLAAGATDAGIEMFSSSIFGGHLRMYEETGDQYGFLEPDVDGKGGFLQVYDKSGNSALQVDGSYAGGDARVVIEGGSSGTVFNTFNSGDGSVELPASAVSSLEMQNEPGVNYTYSGTGLVLTGGAPQTMLSRSIYCPSSGYVLAIGTAETIIDHENGTTSGSYFGVSDESSSFPTGSQLYSRLPLAAATGQYYETITAQLIFQVSPGTETFYFLADEIVGDWEVYDRNLSLVFFPTYYGVLAEPPARVAAGTDLPRTDFAPGPTEADIAAERAECEAANDARIEAELASMAARIEELRASMSDNRQ